MRSPGLSQTTRRDFGHDVYTKLPKIDIDSFSGDMLKWLEFWDSFEAAIHTNPRLSDASKMNYLKGYLKGEAHRVIRGLTLNSQNYEEAVALLKKRYGDREKLRSAFLETLLKIPSSTSDVKKLRCFLDTLEGYLRNLDVLDVAADTYGALLTPQLMKKIPEELRRIIYRRCDGAVVTIDAFRKFLEEEIETRERSAGDNVPQPPEISPPKTKFNKGSNTINQLFTPTEAGKEVRCVFCGQAHAPEKCKTVNSNESRQLC